MSNGAGVPGGDEGSGEPLVTETCSPSLTNGCRPGQVTTHFQVQGGSLHTDELPSRMPSPPPGSAEGLLGSGLGTTGLTARGPECGG
jgi:hypothetical protein